MRNLALFLLLSAATMLAQNLGSSAAIKGTGADLVHQCSDSQSVRGANEGVNAAYAQGYCFGVLTTAAELLDSDGQIHFPEGVSFGQIQKTVMNYLNSHPEEWQKPASLLVKKALRQAWGSS